MTIYSNRFNVGPGTGLVMTDLNGITTIATLSATWPQATPVMLVGPAAGTGASCLILGTNDSMRLQLTIGTAPTNGILFTVQYSNPQNLIFSTNIHPVFSAANAAAATITAADDVYLEIANTTNGFTFNNSAGHLTATQTYIWNVITNLTLASLPLN